MNLSDLVSLQPDMWKKCLDCIDELLDILFEHNNIFIGENIAEDSESLAISDQVSHLHLHVSGIFGWLFVLADVQTIPKLSPSNHVFVSVHV